MDETPADEELSPEEKEKLRVARMHEVSDELARRRRERGAARIPDCRPQPTRQFDAVDLVAYTSKITYNQRGDVVWTVVIPHQYMEMADSLPKTHGLPLHLTVAKWRPQDGVGTQRT